MVSLQSDPHLLNKTIEVLINPVENDVKCIVKNQQKNKGGCREPLLHFL
jgi:hypothetical protein